MSGLALVCRRLGARVTGSDRAESSYLRAPAGRRARAAGRPRSPTLVPEAAEVVVSTAIAEDNPELARARERGQRVIHRGELLAELVPAAAPDRGLGHPRQDDDGRDAGPRAARRRRRPGLLSRRRAARAPAPTAHRRTPAGATGEWVVAEADESDGELPRPAPPRSPWSPTSSSTTTRAGRRAPSCSTRSRAFAGAAARRRAVLAGDDLDRESPRAAPRSLRFDAERPGPEALALRVPGRHNVLNARAALAALELAGFDARRGRRRRSARFPGMLRRQQRKGSRDGRRDLRRLRPPPDRGRGDARGAARARAAAADRGLPAAPLLAHEGARAALRRRARRRRRGRRARRLPGPRAAGRRARRGQRARRRPRGRRPRRRAAGARGCADADTRRAGARRRGSARATCW